MTRIKKATVILAVLFTAGIGAGWALFDYLAENVPAQIEEYSDERD